MFGFFDKWYALRKNRIGYSEQKINWKPEILLHGKSKVVWICFVPTIVSRISLIRRRIIPEEGRVLIYTISSFDLITPEPESTITKLREIYADALERAITAIKNGSSVCLLGVSLGNVLSIRIASQVPTKHLVSIVGGGNLGLSAWDSILTGHIARKSCSASAEEYEAQLCEFSPVRYISEIETAAVTIRLGTSDLLIPFKHGKKLVDAFIGRRLEVGFQIDYRAYQYADHASALFFTSLEDLFRL